MFYLYESYRTCEVSSILTPFYRQGNRSRKTNLTQLISGRAGTQTQSAHICVTVQTLCCFSHRHMHRDICHTIIWLFFFFFFFFLGPHLQHMEVHRLGLNGSCSCRPTPQPQQCRIRASSVTYTTAHCNTGSLTHWSRPGIKPTSSWILVGLLPLSHDGNSKGQIFNQNIPVMCQALGWTPILTT